MARGQEQKPGLNDAQKKAVDITDGPVLVVAGAGTGKTRVIVERIQHLMAGGVPAESILALTFTEKAAAEMLDRLSRESLESGLDVTAATFNGFGNDLLQAYGAEYGLGSLRLLGETGQLVFLREHLDDFELDYFSPISNPDGQLKLLAGYVSLLKQQLVQPADYTAYAAELKANTDEQRLEKQKQQELAAFYETYLKLCRGNQLIDYDDQLFLTIELLRARPNILAHLQGRFRYILVDEFQDTNPMQSALVDLLAGKSQNVMVVGDDDQSIYGWRGATLANILDFKLRYPKAEDVTLIENYRSTQEILDSAYRLIRHNDPNRLEVLNKLDKHLIAKAGNGLPPRALHFSTLDAELTWVAEDIQKRLAKGQAGNQIAVLARRNLGVEKMHELLELYDIPHAVAGLGNDIYREAAVRQLIEALKAVADPHDDLALYHALSGPLFAIEPQMLAAAAAQARREHISLLEALSGSEDEQVVSAMQVITDWRSQAHQLTVGDLAYMMISDTRWKQQLYSSAEHDVTVYIQVQALSKYFRTLKEFERIAGVPSVQNYIANLPALQAAGSGFEDATLEISDELVNVMSVHRAKGLEWDTVYIVDCSEGSFPMRNFGSKMEVPDALKATVSAADEHMAEERRLMYVAATRARKELILTHADKHGSGAVRKASRFIGEMLEGTESTLHEEAAQTSLELYAPHATPDVVPLPQDMQQDGRLVLSVSQIDCWLRCPQDFYYRYVLQMPTPPAPQLQYGTLLHGVIERLHKARADGELPTLEELTSHVVEQLPRAGYASAKSRERAHKQAVESVKALYERFSSDELPIEAEKPFGVVVPDVPLKIIGRIDAVYKLGDGVEIRDFKTGTSVTTEKKAKDRATGSQQLALYALAWQIMHNELPALLTLDFVETGLQGSVRKQAKSLDTLTDKLRTLVAAVQAGSYPPGRDHDFCSHPH